MKIIYGISGVARSGKDTATQIIINKCKEKGITAKRFALADALKQDCKDFIEQKLGLNVFSQDTKEKDLIRPLLVWYGDVKRKQSNGKYWIDIITNHINNSDASVCIVSDIRYAQYEYDELQWVKEKGKLIHIRQSYFDEKGNIAYLQAPNEHERINDPILRENADYKLKWPKTEFSKLKELYVNETLTQILNPVIQDVYSRVSRK